ncbi:AmmeMemoRadiSam system protein B [Candidatus Uhrbacteria bacterium]|nr:AmmeMemoRadiSam system protein B [Candidatus Uhrbacteria bacterium]
MFGFKPVFIIAVLLLGGTGFSVSAQNRFAPAFVLETSFKAKEVYPVPKDARILIIPHHLVAGREIASLLASTPAPKNVFLLSPDHFSSGEEFLTTDSIRQADEHGIHGLVPFIEQAWPGAQIVPAMLRIDTPTGTRLEITQKISSELIRTPDSILIATIDFSHYLPVFAADFHDEYSADMIRSLSCDKAYTIELDAPGIFEIACMTARRLGLAPTIHANTNSLSLMKAEIAQDSTSHFLVSFSPGAPAERQTKTTFISPPGKWVSAENRLEYGFDARMDLDLDMDLAIGMVESSQHTILYFMPHKTTDQGHVLLTGSERMKRLSELGLPGSGVVTLLK